MATVNLKDQATCSKNQFNASKLTKDAANAAKDAAVTMVQAAVDSAVGVALDITNTTIDATSAAVQSVVDQVNAEIQAAEDAYASVKNAIISVYDTATGLFNKKCTVTSDPTKPTIDQIIENASIAKTNNDDIINTSNINKLYYQINPAKAQGSSKLGQLYGKLANEIKDNAGIYELRSFVDTADTHTNVQKLLQDLSIFKPVSEYIGSWVMAYTPDTPSLPLACWGQNFDTTPDAPVAVRLNMVGKLPKGVRDNIEKSYVGLNNEFVKNISNEFMEGSNKSAPSFVAHAYRIVGDYSFYNYHIKKTPSGTIPAPTTLLSIDPNYSTLPFLQSSMLQLAYKAITSDMYTDRYDLIKYLNPIDEQDIKINTDNYSIEITDSISKTVATINKKGDFIN